MRNEIRSKWLDILQCQVKWRIGKYKHSRLHNAKEEDKLEGTQNDGRYDEIMVNQEKVKIGVII